MKELSINLEKNAEGKEYNGLLANSGNSLWVQIRVPSKFMGHQVRYDTSGEAGIIDFPDRDCSIKYRLSNSESPGALGSSGITGSALEGTAIDPLGSLVLDANSFNGGSGFSLRYFPSTQPLGKAVDLDFVHVSLWCDGKEQISTMQGFVIWKPLVFLVPGLWHTTLQRDAAVFESFIRKGIDIVPVWYDDTTQDITVTAALLKETIEKTISEKEKGLIKVGKVDVIGHSMGGLAGRYYAANLGGWQKVGKLITLGTPHVGAPIVKHIKLLCPFDEIKEDDQGCKDYAGFVQQLNIKKFLGNEFGKIGKGLTQLDPDSKFLREELMVPPPPLEMILFAGNKARVPPWVKEFPGTIPGAGILFQFLGWAAREGIGIPEGSKQLFHNFVLSLMDKDSDGTVPIWSQWGNLPGKSLGNQVKRVMFSLGHPELYTKEISHKAASYEIYRRPYTVASLGSPATFYTYDAFGNVVGIKGDELRKEIPKSEVYQDPDGKEIVFLEGASLGNVILQGNGNGTLDFSVGIQGEEKSVMVHFEDVPVQEGTKGMSLGDQENLVLAMDYNGDGITDEQKSPDLVEVREVPSLSHPQEKTGTVDLIFPDEKEGFSPGIIFGIAGLLVILGLWWYGKRKR